jgi:hypothetical protein
VADNGWNEIPGEAFRRELLSESRKRARQMAWLYAVAAAVLLPWIGYLAVTLPRRNLDLHYRAAWVGFDILLAVAILRTAYMAFRVDPRVQFPATATAVLLFVDAWFDVSTSGNRSQLFEALVLAGCFEIPAALFSLYLARQANRRVLEYARLTGTIPDHLASGPPEGGHPRGPGGEADGPGSVGLRP